MGFSKQLNKLRSSLISKKSKGKALVLECGTDAGKCTDSLLEQLEDVIDCRITHITLEDSLQRPDNVRIFTCLKKILLQDKCRLQQVHLIEPQVKADNYKRWCFKRTAFIHHCYQTCKEHNVKVRIDATLVLSTPEEKPQDVSSWLSVHFPKTIPQDPDLTSLKINLRASGGDHVIPQVFQALIDALNNGNRKWKLIQCHVLYATKPKYAVPQTEALVEVADCYNVPLQVEWEPLDQTGQWKRCAYHTKAALQLLCPVPSEWQDVAKSLEDTTASTVDGSSGALMASH